MTQPVAPMCNNRIGMEKLMDLALWFDMHAEERGIHGQDEVQKDLRRIAQRLLKIDGGKSFTRGQAG